MIGYVTDIEKATEQNNLFRQVLYTAPHSQLVIMSLDPGEEIGEETHAHVDQFIRVESGEGRAVLDGEEYHLANGSAVVIPAGTKHNIINTSNRDHLKLYTLYSPAEHKDGTIHKTKEEALADEKDHA